VHALNLIQNAALRQLTALQEELIENVNQLTI
jgi:hypothetical protein